ncbi:hypothetical protein [Gloeobacter kilaueensis]|uniref:CRISPR type III-B/RAMP module-associated protein Cmr5 n=1 Tax=Gloeobacter kilaueensis (strain ATCC BAA-2537 / CCAP 1431/1 / ULC 316 / JS1) TaxID=1183438 RepID=U5QMW4_GLOK1|nr:hypothetical protein [Gloeobacter kilaueensis]AGY60302.1 hypothetical protein GKIL_4056 [Gloeobacter kilaueensis JS1]
MSWQSYQLDRAAQELVLRHRDKGVLNQSYKMRQAAAFGLERFWGEHVRLMKEDATAAGYWKQTWDSLVTILKKAGLELPNHTIKDPKKTQDIQAMADELWKLSPQKQRVALAVLVQFCDCLIWWTQRYKTGKEKSDG